MAERFCKRCQQTFPLTAEFFYISAERYGKRYRCKFCYRKRCKNYYARNKEFCRTLNDEWKRLNKERYDLARIEWAKQNPEKARRSQRKTWAKYAERYRERKRAYRKAHPEIFRLKGQLERLKRRNVPGTITKAKIAGIYLEQGGRCFYCDVLLPQGYHIDHKVPVCRGGTNNPDNLCCACPICNLRKGSKTHEEFLWQSA